MPVIIPGSGSGGSGGGSFIPSTYIFTINMGQYPEWAMPMAKLIPKVYVDDSEDISNVSVICRCRHIWHRLDGTTDSSGIVVYNWEIRVEVYLQCYKDNDTLHTVNGYIDLDLVIFNERVWEELNPNKT